MGYSKRQFVEAAYEELGVGDYEFDLNPDQLLRAAQRLDRMMAEWDALNIRLGYPLSSDPDSVDLDSTTSVPARANSAIVCGLALRLGPSIGKVPSPDTRFHALQGFNAMLAAGVQRIPVQLPNDAVPAGAGQKRWRTFLDVPTDPLESDNGGTIDGVDLT